MTDVSVLVCVAFDHRAPATLVHGFRQLVLSSPNVASVLAVSGAYDLIVESRCDTMDEHAALMERLHEPLARIATQVETCFIIQQLRQEEPGAAAIWLPCEGGRRRVAVQAIDRISAEGDYMRVHVEGWTALVHSTMRKLAAQLPPCFVRLNRSCLVRCDHVERVIHRGQRWVATLRDGEEVAIARSHLHEVLRKLGVESSTQQVPLSTDEQLAEKLISVNERQRP